MEEAHRVQQIVDRNCSLNSVKLLLILVFCDSSSHQALPKSMFKKKRQLLSFIYAVASCLVNRHKAFYKCFIAYGAGLGADEGEQHRLFHPRVTYNRM